MNNSIPGLNLPPGFSRFGTEGTLRSSRRYPPTQLRQLHRVVLLLCCVLVCALAPQAHAQDAGPPGDPQDNSPLIRLGPGDSVTISVYGQPDLTANAYVTDDGTLPVGLVGKVPVAGLSPSAAAQRIEAALRDGNFLVHPQVSLTVTQSRSQRVTVLGEVARPGRFTIDSTSTVFDLLAQAGGTTQNSSDTVYLIRKDASGNSTRTAIPLKGLAGGQAPQQLRSGDSIYVPRAEQFSIMGEVKTPNSYRLEPGMTVMEAVARAGGITDKGSTRRMKIVRRVAEGKEEFITLKAAMTDIVQPNDVIRVGQSIF
ncbi:MAG TPA: SLBB domain-containing protein [Steroidobacteraceae bacterium]|nr:SLBB domain-containing protein [Steroidobacteraceae bacterium]